MISGAAGPRKMAICDPKIGLTTRAEYVSFPMSANPSRSFDAAHFISSKFRASPPQNWSEGLGVLMEEEMDRVLDALVKWQNKWLIG